ncbi:Zn-dependent hydrolase [Patescibacteria group bacterium]|nr:MAG: Zn-dependent hydrolase [Patescibacteria group bacterium]
MEIEYKGANCVTISTKKATLVIDPKLSHVGLKDVTPKESIVVATQADLLVAGDSLVVIDRPGEYEVRDISITGSAAELMIDHDKGGRSTIYRLDIGGTRLAVVGHVAAPLTEDQLESLGVIDVAIVPVGGNGYTLDAHQAVGVVRQLNPKVVIPTHYEDNNISYEVPQMDLAAFVKELAPAQTETVTKWKPKTLPEVLTLVEIERSV